MPLVWSAELFPELPVERRLVEDRRSNPVHGRRTLFRLLQQNMLAYTYAEGIPGFAAPGANSLPFQDLILRAQLNAEAEGRSRFGADFVTSTQQIAKVLGDVFEVVETAIHWNAAARWNGLMTGSQWPTTPRYPRPGVVPDPGRQVAVLGLPRGYDWVRLLTPVAQAEVNSLRLALRERDLGLPTSTPDLLIVALPAHLRNDERFRHELTALGLEEQHLLSRMHAEFEGHVRPEEFVLAIALKKSLRSDRLYQPLYEANVMQLLLEGRLGAPLVDFEVHTLGSAGTGARLTYTAASLAVVATGHAVPHRAIRELYEPQTAQDLARRFLLFLEHRAPLTGPR
jgi:hypothetical protein